MGEPEPKPTHPQELRQAVAKRIEAIHQGRLAFHDGTHAAYLQEQADLAHERYESTVTYRRSDDEGDS